MDKKKKKLTFKYNPTEKMPMILDENLQSASRLNVPKTCPGNEIKLPKHINALWPYVPYRFHV